MQALNTQSDDACACTRLERIILPDLYSHRTCTHSAVIRTRSNWSKYSPHRQRNFTRIHCYRNGRHESHCYITTLVGRFFHVSNAQTYFLLTYTSTYRYTAFNTYRHTQDSESPSHHPVKPPSTGLSVLALEQCRSTSSQNLNNLYQQHDERSTERLILERLIE